jgi:amino acid adenylation domain-containing protein
LRLAAQVDDSIDPSRVCGMMQRALEALVTALEQAPETPVCTLEVLTSEERRQVLFEWNTTEAEFPGNRVVHQLFEEQAEKTPDAVAVLFEGRKLRYSELNRQANRLAHYLRELDVKPDDRVAICVERGFQMIVGLLAILKAGGAYVPLDPAYPVERLRFMLDDSAAVVLLTESNLAGRFSGDSIPNRPTLLLDSSSSPWNSRAHTNPDAAAIGLTSAHLAYVIYTSGSTGTPKGVLLEHRGLVNLVCWHAKAFDLRRKQRTSSLAGFGFDAATWEIWPPLCVGGTLVMPSSATTMNSEVLLTWWKKQALNVSFLPTPIAELAFAREHHNPQLRTLLIGGDRLNHIPPANTLSYSVVNNYGPTETTVVATSCLIGASTSRLSIGRPIANTRVYILDRQGQPVPVGVTGEIYIGGAGVARGYLNRPELTAERFLEDPFVSEPNGRMYRTGDLGRWLPDGTIDFLGRNDLQVKIRGFRIELGEIEARLREYPDVREALVLAREDTPGDKRLVAYYVAAADQNDLGAEVLRRRLSSALPEYMVPAAYVRLESLPLTPNGKLDRKALPAPEEDAYSIRGYEAPQGQTEVLLAQLWAEVLNVDRVGRRDNFFELGGHSINAVHLIERMRQIGLEADVRALFATPTIADLVTEFKKGEISL